LIVQLINTLVGTVAGIVAAFVTLIISHSLLAPRIRFSPDIRVKWSEERQGYTYCVRIKKTGYIDLIETYIQCRIAIQDVGKTGGDLWNNYTIPTTFEYNVIMSRSARYVYLKFHESDLLGRERNRKFQKNTRIYVPEFGLRAEDIFMSHKNAFIRIHILGHDRFTGIKKVFISPKYQFLNLRFGDWKCRQVVGR
jgi:hypothetical protein